MIATALTRLFELEHPIVLAPMGVSPAAVWQPQCPTPAASVWLAVATVTALG